MKKNEVVFDVVKTKEEYRSNNARKVNSKKKPNGYLYIIQNTKFDIIKIGVSSSPKRRIKDINSNLPFETKTIFLKYYEDVYSLEEMSHNVFKNNQVKGEWFQVYQEDVDELVNVLKQLT